MNVTKDIAIKLIDERMCFGRGKWSKYHPPVIDEYWKAGRMAIEALTQTPNDLISRKWLMECVEEGWIKFDTETDKNKFIHLVRDTAPSAQPEQKKAQMNYWMNE